MKKSLLFLLLSLGCLRINAQHDGKTIDKLKVFIDCSSTWCDMNYVRTEVNLVDFMLDRVAADVHVLITQQNTGGGGRKYQLIFFGQNLFKHLKDTILFNTGANATDFEKRDFLLKYIQLGLAPYVAKTRAGDHAVIKFKQAVSESQNKDSASQTKKDPWNYWVFNSGVNGNLSADENYKNSSVSLRFSANRVTEKSKTGLNARGSKNKSVFEIDDGNGNVDKITIKNDNYSIEHYLIASLGQHWSYAYQASFSRSTFSNNKRRLMFETGIEYAIFPYKDVNTKFFTVSYRLDVRHNKYFDTTLYEKIEEVLFGHGFETDLSFNQKWGTVNFGAEYHNYFHNWRLYRLGISSEVNIRISGGLSFNIGTFAELTRDQIFLPKAGATPQEVLTRRRQLASGYNFFTHFGLNYRFGSKVNNFVNPRFD